MTYFYALNFLLHIVKHKEKWQNHNSLGNSVDSYSLTDQNSEVLNLFYGMP